MQLICSHTTTSQSVDGRRRRHCRRPLSDESTPQVLHKLGGWPVGLWQRADAGSVPYGELLQVQPLTSGASGFQGRIINPRGAVADGMFIIRVAGQQGVEVSSSSCIEGAAR